MSDPTDLAALGRLADRLAALEEQRIDALYAAQVLRLAPLRRGGQSGYWTPAPRSKGVRVHRNAIYGMVRAGVLKWGNKSHSFVVPAEDDAA